MNDVEILIQRAADLAMVGDKENALIELNNAFELLIIEASEYALNKEGLTRDSDLSLKRDELLNHSNKYLAKDLVASNILNTMGLLFSEIEEYDAAYQKFEDAISLIPEGITFNEPFENKKMALEKIQSLNQEIAEGRDGFID